MRVTEDMNLTDVFVKAVMDSIMTGEVKQGEKLPSEREYCEQFFVSRSVVNRGLRRLAEMGFIEILPREGAYVKDVMVDGGIDAINAIIRYNSMNFTPEFFEPLLETRRSFESAMMALAAQHHDKTHCRKAADHLRQMERTEDPVRLGDLSFRVVNAIACASGNVMFPLLINTFKEVYIAMGIAVFSCGFRDIFIRDWNEILAAVRAGDAERARAIDKAQIAAGGKWMNDHYRPGSAFPTG